MPKGVLIAMTNPVAGKEDEYNEWYDKQHLAELLDVPGISAAQRFSALPSATGALPPQQYLAVYEIETDDVPGILAAIRESRKDGPPASPALDTSSATLWLFAAIGDRVEATQI